MLFRDVHKNSNAYENNSRITLKALVLLYKCFFVKRKSNSDVNAFKATLKKFQVKL